MFTAQITPPPVAAFSKDVFEPMGNHYIVRQGGRYHYFPTKVEKHPPNAPMPILKFEKLPPVLMEGWVTTQHRTYLVTVQDLLRGIVRTSNEYVLVKKDETGTSAMHSIPSSLGSNAGRSGEGGQTEDSQQQAFSAVQADAPPPVGDVRTVLEPGVVEALGVELDEIVNRTFDQQVAALQHLEDSEEER